MASYGEQRRYPPDSLANLRFNVLLDGLFHAATYVFVAIGLTLLWRAARRPHVPWSGKMLVGALLMGFGIFNVVEGIINHHILGLHRVKRNGAARGWFYWDLGFLAWGAGMLAGGWLLLEAGKRETAAMTQVAELPIPQTGSNNQREV